MINHYTGNQFKTLELLLKNGADPNSMIFGNDILFSGIAFDFDIRTLKLFIDYGAIASQKTLDAAVNKCRFDAVRLFLQNGTKVYSEDFLCELCYSSLIKGQYKILSLLIDYSTYINGAVTACLLDLQLLDKMLKNRATCLEIDRIMNNFKLRVNINSLVHFGSMWLYLIDKIPELGVKLQSYSKVLASNNHGAQCLRYIHNFHNYELFRRINGCVLNDDGKNVLFQIIEDEVPVKTIFTEYGFDINVKTKDNLPISVYAINTHKKHLLKYYYMNAKEINALDLAFLSNKRLTYELVNSYNMKKMNNYFHYEFFVNDKIPFIFVLIHLNKKDNSYSSKYNKLVTQKGNNFLHFIMNIEDNVNYNLICRTLKDGLIEKENIRGWTPVFNCYFKNNVTNMNTINMFNVDINHVDYFGKTPLYYKKH